MAGLRDDLVPGPDRSRGTRLLAARRPRGGVLHPHGRRPDTQPADLPGKARRGREDRCSTDIAGPARGGAPAHGRRPRLASTVFPRTAHHAACCVGTTLDRGGVGGSRGDGAHPAPARLPRPADALPAHHRARRGRARPGTARGGLPGTRLLGRALRPALRHPALPGGRALPAHVSPPPVAAWPATLRSGLVS